MRLDKWLKVSRLIKRRTLAQIACEQGRIFVNDRTAKSAYEVKVRDIIHLELGLRALTVEVKCVPDGAVPAQNASSLYELVEELRRTPENLELTSDYQ